MGVMKVIAIELAEKDARIAELEAQLAEALRKAKMYEDAYDRASNSLGKYEYGGHRA